MIKRAWVNRGKYFHLVRLHKGYPMFRKGSWINYIFHGKGHSELSNLAYRVEWLKSLLVLLFILIIWNHTKDQTMSTFHLYHLRQAVWCHDLKSTIFWTMNMLYCRVDAWLKRSSRISNPPDWYGHLNSIIQHQRRENSVMNSNKLTNAM